MIAQMIPICAKLNLETKEESENEFGDMLLKLLLMLLLIDSPSQDLISSKESMCGLIAELI